jgi:hypothetical protein
MYTLRLKSPHAGKSDYKDAVEAWQNFLIGRDFDIKADGYFGSATEKATKEFQSQNGLTPDGKAGNSTLGLAMSKGLELVDDDPDPIDGIPESSPLFPPPPTNIGPKTNADREQFFGHFAHVHAPTPSMPERIRITDGWSTRNVHKVLIPQLVGINGAPDSGNVYFHDKVAAPVQALFAAWETAGLMHLVLGWAGSFVPRYIKGSRTILSNHAFAAAFDINVPWNGLGARPALVGRKGSVRLLVPLANQHGFYWGGHYKKRKDGMHFEFMDY